MSRVIDLDKRRVDAQRKRNMAEASEPAAMVETSRLWKQRGSLEGWNKWLQSKDRSRNKW